MIYRSYSFYPFRALLERFRKGEISRDQFTKMWSEEQFRQLELGDARREEDP